MSEASAGLPMEFGEFNPVEARRAATRTGGSLRYLTWLRMVTIVGCATGCAVGAGFGATGFRGSLEETLVALAGGFIGLLVGLSLGLVFGFAYAAEAKSNRRADVSVLLTELALSGRAPNFAEVVQLIFGIAGLQGLRRMEPWDLLLVGISLGAWAGAVLGAELFLQGFGEVGISMWTVGGALAGGLLGSLSCLGLITLLWRRR
jgi:hypothetical protein